MIKALLWKEWRESRMYFFMILLIVPVFSLLLNSTDYVKETKADAFLFLYILTFCFFAVLTAANQFTGEGESGTLDFLLSRPVHRIGIWLFKIIYGTASLILFGIFLYIMSTVFVAPLLDSDTLPGMFFNLSSGFAEYINCDGVLLCLTILGLYFVGSTVSIILRSSFKSMLVTFLLAAGVFYILLFSYLELYFKASHYIYLTVFPVFFFIIYMRYRPSSLLTRAAYILLPAAGLLIWILISYKGESLWTLLAGNYSDKIFSRGNIIMFPVIGAVCLSGILTSLFAFGIIPRGYPVWWKFLSCLNFLAVLGICFVSFLVLSTPTTQEISSVYRPYRPYYQSYMGNTDHHFIIGNIHKLGNKYYTGNQPFNRQTKSLEVSQKYFLLDCDKGKPVFYGKGHFLLGDFHRISKDSRWIIYSAPLLRWGISYTWGLWAENLDTSEQHLLTSTPGINSITGEWFNKSRRFILIHYDERRPLKKRFLSDVIYTGFNPYVQKITLFSFENEIPEKLNTPSPEIPQLIHIDRKDRLYFRNFNNNIISRFNGDLKKEQDITAVQEKLSEFQSRYEPDRKSSIYARTSVISPGGEYMIFFVTGSFFDRDTEKKKGTWRREIEIWVLSLTDGSTKKINDMNFVDYYYRWGFSQWHPFEDNLLIDTALTKPGSRQILLRDLEKGSIWTLLEKEVNTKSEYFNVSWSGNGKYFLTGSTDLETGNVTIGLYAFDKNTHSCTPVSVKSKFKNQGSFPWSKNRLYRAFGSEDGKNIWVLDFTAGKWKKISCPFDNYILLGVSNRGEVFINRADRIEFYRLTENSNEIILQGN